MNDGDTLGGCWRYGRYTVRVGVSSPHTGARIRRQPSLHDIPDHTHDRPPRLRRSAGGDPQPLSQQALFGQYSVAKRWFTMTTGVADGPSRWLNSRPRSTSTRNVRKSPGLTRSAGNVGCRAASSGGAPAISYGSSS